MKRASRWTLRLVAGAVMFLALGGPAPGNVGGCGSTVPVADAKNFCFDRNKAKCDRDHYAQRITQAQYDQCVAAIAGQCESFAWPPGCTPTPAQAQACINLLLQVSYANQTTEDLLATHDECGTNLCM